MTGIELPNDEDEVSFAPAPSPEEARARLAALRGKPLDGPSRLVTEPEVVKASEEGLTLRPTAPADMVSLELPADKMARLMALLENEEPKAEPQKPASAVKKADSPLFKAKKVRITTRIDADVLEAFKAGGDGWQTRINDVLRANMPSAPTAED
jgi:uncharacterized protein (DUF4415 family)